MRELKKNKEQETKGSKKQQEYIIQLEQKYRDICAKAGVSASPGFVKEGIVDFDFG